MHLKMLCKGTKKNCDFQIFARKVCVLTLHFAQILHNINKVSDRTQKREGYGSDKKHPSRASSPLNKGLSNKTGGREGFFRIRQKIASESSKTRTPLIEYSCPVRLMITLSPTASDSQSVTSGLAVRQDGLYPILKS